MTSDRLYEFSSAALQRPVAMASLSLSAPARPHASADAKCRAADIGREMLYVRSAGNRTLAGRVFALPISQKSLKGGDCWRPRRSLKVRALSADGFSGGNGNVKEFSNKDEFMKYIEEAGNKLVVVDISTKTCGPCKLIYPKFVQLSLDFPDAVFLKIMGDSDADTRALMREWGVRSVPNFRFFQNGSLIHSHTGAKEDELRRNFLSFYSKVTV